MKTINTARYWDACFRAYLECVLWQETLFCEPCAEYGSSRPEECAAGEDFHCGRGYDETFSIDDIDNPQDAETDLRDFLVANWRDVRDLDPGQVGHDFCLTRNGHGAGFWDRGLGERGERLSDAARVYGEVSLTWFTGPAGNTYVGYHD